MSLAPSKRALKRKVLELERLMLASPGQIDLPVKHHFAPDVYGREMCAPAGTLVIGHEHKTSHLNVLLKGSCVLFMGDETRYVQAPMILTSEPGTRKVAWVLEDMTWLTVHHTKESNLERIEDELVIKSPVWRKAHKCQLRQLRQS